MTAYKPKKQSSSFDFWSWLNTPVFNLFNNTFRYGTEKEILASPVGPYSGGFTQTLSPEGKTTIENPYGTGLQIGSLDSPLPFNIVLSPGQTLDLKTGRLSDPNLHAGTAQRLNNQIQSRQVKEAGLSQAESASARTAPSVLAAIDDLYYANTKTSVQTSLELSQLSLAKQEGFNSSGTKTILGAAKPPVPVSKKFEIH